MSNNQVVKLRRKELAACMTCPICNKLLRDATTIPECCHTFCRKCIHKKFTDEELECCPTCNIDLGCVPLEKLRPDNNLQDVREKIFPSKRRRVKAPEIVPSVTLPLKRKERSLSSLVVNTPRVSPQTTLTGKRTKVPPRKKPRDKSVKKEDNSIEGHEDSSSSREISNKLTHNLRQNSLTPEASSDPSPDLWKPLNYLVEVANRSKSNVKSEPQHTRKPKGKDQLKIIKNQDENGRSDVDVTESEKPKKIRKYHKKKAVIDADANNVVRDKRINPIWFHLVPSQQQEGEPLGQIQGSFVRLKDGNIPVSVIQKFVMSKLKLESEHEVELRCMDQVLVPTMLLSNLAELWLQKQLTTQTISVMIGSSAKEYMMEISYARKTSA